MPRKQKRKKHQPQRTCVGCQEVLSKRSLIRIVRLPDSVQVDQTGKLAGRGAYLHDRRSCWESGLKGSLAKALRRELSNEDRQTLAEYMASLPQEELEKDRVDKVPEISLD